MYVYISDELYRFFVNVVGKCICEYELASVCDCVYKWGIL